MQQLALALRGGAGGLVDCDVCRRTPSLVFEDLISITPCTRNVRLIADGTLLYEKSEDQERYSPFSPSQRLDS